MADSIVYTEEGTATYAGHSYAFYSNSNTALPSLGWGQTYDAARDLGGYLGTFTTSLEWLEVHTALASTPNLSGARLWIGATQAQIGMAIISPGATRFIYQWITGENSQQNFDEISSPTDFGGTFAFNNFNPGEPNDVGMGAEGFIEMSSGSIGVAGTNFGWNDVPEGGSDAAGVPLVRGFVVEFQQ